MVAALAFVALASPAAFSIEGDAIMFRTAIENKGLTPRKFRAELEQFVERMEGTTGGTLADGHDGLRAVQLAHPRRQRARRVGVRAIRRHSSKYEMRHLLGDRHTAGIRVSRA